MSSFDIHSVDMRIVQNRKKWFAIPAIVLALAIIAGVVYGVVFNGAVFNAGVDFTGGYAITVSIGAGLDNEETRADYEERITDVIENPGEYSAELADMNVKGLNVRSFSVQKEGADKELKVLFTAPGYSDSQMVGTDDSRDGIVYLLCDAILEAVRSSEDIFGINAVPEERVTASIGAELIIAVVCAAALFLALMFVYLSVRYDFAMAGSMILGVVIDLVMTTALMCIFRIELSAMFVIALIAVLVLSLAGKLIVFSDARRAVKEKGASVSPTDIANSSVRDTFVRSIVCSSVAIGAVAVMTIFGAAFSVTSLVLLGLPVILGLVSGLISSLLVSPSVWAVAAERGAKAKAASAAAQASAPAAEQNSFFGFDDIKQSGTEEAGSDSEAPVGETPPEEAAAGSDESAPAEPDDAEVGAATEESAGNAPDEAPAGDYGKSEN